jgi:hypothetical protein
VSRRIVAALGSLLLAIACGGRESPEQRLERLRAAHDLRPLGYANLSSAGQPTLTVDLVVVNQGEEPLARLTVLVRVRGADGVETALRRVTLDLSGFRPGIAGEVTASLPGISLEERGEVTVELETDLPADILRSLPEFESVRAAGTAAD